MPDDPDFLARSFQYLQDNVRRSCPAAAASYTLIGGIVLFGGIGYAVDHWRGTLSYDATLKFSHRCIPRRNGARDCF